MRAHAVAAIVVSMGAAAALIASCGGAGNVNRSAGDEMDCAVHQPEVLDVEVVSTLSHDPNAYTQGLVMDDDRLYESTGRYGESELRELDSLNGEVLRAVELPAAEFGEGLALTSDGTLVQLTWKEGVAHRWDSDTFAPAGTNDYSGEGWGLAALDESTLIQSDGTDELVRRDPDDFAELSRQRILRSGGPADMLNELEWDGKWLWANRYQSDELLRIDQACGVVTGVADLSALREDAEATALSNGSPIDVTNGVAHIPGSDRYLVTGKLWPTMYEIRII